MILYIGFNGNTTRKKYKMKVSYFFEKQIRGRISPVLGDQYVKSNENNKIVYIEVDKLYGLAISQYINYKDVNSDKKVHLEKNSKNTR